MSLDLHIVLLLPKIDPEESEPLRHVGSDRRDQ